MILRIFLTLFMLMTGIQAQNLGETILKSELFGCYKEKVTDSTLNEFVVIHVDSISKAETVAGVGSQLRIGYQYSFEKLPCIRYYLLEDEHWPIFENLKPYYNIFFNNCDSTFYPSNGNDKRFSKLIRICLPELVCNGEQQVLDICLLFLYTAGRKPLGSVNDYKELWDEYLNILSNETRKYLKLTDKYIISDIEMVKKAIHPNDMLKPILVFNEEDHYRLSVSAWEPNYGDIERWSFAVSASVFEVKNIYRALERMGPYVRRERDFHEKTGR